MIRSTYFWIVLLIIYAAAFYTGYQWHKNHSCPDNGKQMCVFVEEK